ncbi:MAG: hypothetical protein MUP67_10850 [Acidimicrobiia bacterium]|jgi:hypothetical protein|nr:hypothetical protein [Acidimicrobiia bacterium]
MPPTEPEQILHDLLGREATALEAMVAAALGAPERPDLLVQADRLAVTTRDRHVVAIAAAHLRGDRDVVDAFARDHLADHPDSVLVAWIAGAGARFTHPDQPDPKETT